MILVSLLNPKFAKVPAEQSRELRIRDTSADMISPAATNRTIAIDLALTVLGFFRRLDQHSVGKTGLPLIEPQP